MVFAQDVGEIPLIPHSFYGEIKISDQNAPPGTKIYAFMNGFLKGSIETTESGFYGRFPKLAVEGTSQDKNKPIVFCIGLLKAQQTAYWQPAKVERLNLSSSVESCPYALEPTLTPSPSPTTTSTIAPTPTRTPETSTGSSGSGSGGQASPTIQPAKTPAITEKILFEETIDCLPRADLEGFLAFVNKEQRKKSALSLEKVVKIERKTVLKEMVQEAKKWFRVEILLSIKNNSGKKIENLFLIEEIPKEIAETSDKIKSTKNFSVLIKDPVVEFFLGSIEKDASAFTQYYADIEEQTDSGDLKSALLFLNSPVAYEVKESRECNDNNPCTIDEYNEANASCQHTMLPDGTQCAQGKECKSGNCTTIKETPAGTEKPPETTSQREKNNGFQDYFWLIIVFLGVLLLAGIFILIRKYNILKAK
ncbi:MAG: hypothetical protein QXK06_03950 [Candidatus Diapherotrites archaeon]